MTIWTVTQDEINPARALFEGPMTNFPCAAGKNGFIPMADGREGDGKTPAGLYPIRRVFYRPDRLQLPVTQLKIDPILPDYGWCDDPAHPCYNQLITRPFTASHETLWREDAVYDLIIVIGHNDNPIIKGHGSAVFIHIAREGYQPTEGCIALSQTHLLKFLSLALPQDQIDINIRL